MATKAKQIGQFKGLQGLTKKEKEFEKLLKEDIISEEALNRLSKEERDELVEFIKTKVMPTVTADDREKFLSKLMFLYDQSTRNMIWEQNHNRITWAISVALQETGRMPSATEVSTKVNLSRPTIYKHLREYQNEDFYKDHLSQFRMMRSRILGTLYKQATLDGNTKAARIFMEATGGLPTGPALSVNNQQNNFLQINGTVVTQESLSNLLPEQLKQFESLIKSLENKSPKRDQLITNKFQS